MVVFNISLIVTDPHLYASLVTEKLCSAYEYATSPQTLRGQVFKYDVYHNSVASALSCIIINFKWSSIMSAEGSKCIMKLSSLVADQMKSLCTRKVTRRVGRHQVALLTLGVAT